MRDKKYKPKNTNQGNKEGNNMVKAEKIIKPVVVTKGDRCLDCGKKISQKKFAAQEGLCDKCYSPFIEEVSQEEHPAESFGDI